MGTWRRSWHMNRKSTHTLNNIPEGVYGTSGRTHLYAVLATNRLFAEEFPRKYLRMVNISSSDMGFYRASTSSPLSSLMTSDHVMFMILRAIQYHSTVPGHPSPGSEDHPWRVYSSHSPVARLLFEGVNGTCGDDGEQAAD